MTSLLSRRTAQHASDIRRPTTEAKLSKTATRRQRRETSRRPIFKHGIDFNGYYGTYRLAGFDGQHWLKELPSAERRKAEKVCADVLRRLDYPLIYPEEEADRGESGGGRAV